MPFYFFMYVSMNHVLRLCLFCLFSLFPILKFKNEIISFLSFSVHFQPIYPPAFHVQQVEWKASFMHKGFGDDILIFEGSRYWESFVWKHNIQGYTLIQYEKENVSAELFQNSHLKCLVDG